MNSKTSLMPNGKPPFIVISGRQMERKTDGKLYQIVKTDNTKVINSGGQDNKDVEMQQNLPNSKNGE